MPSTSDNEKGGIKVEIFKLANRLKDKLGMRVQTNEDGFLDPEMIREADRLIEVLCEECPRTIAGHLDRLGELWGKMRDMKDSPERTALSQEVFTLAHEVKDIGSMCGYDLIAYFAESLRDYIGRTELSIDAQCVIIQAHVDAMTVVNRRGIKREAGPEAEELKKMVKVAITKYS